MAGAPRAFVENGEGIEVLAKPIFVRAQPFNGSGTAAPFNGWHAPCLAGAPCAWLACLMPALRPIGSGFEIREVGAEFYQFFL